MWTAVFALGIVLVLIVLGVWLLKLVFNATGNAGRGRNRRLTVIDSAAVDPKRQVVLIRRDNVEHLILTGGPQDLVLESGIAVPPPPVSRPARRPLGQADVQPAAQRRPYPEPRMGVTPQPQRQSEPAVGPAAALPLAEPRTVDAQKAQGPAPKNDAAQTGMAAAGRRPTSLRHTGLLRPVSSSELSLPDEDVAQKTPRPRSDSVKTRRSDAAPKPAAPTQEDPPKGEGGASLGFDNQQKTQSGG